MQYKSQYLIRVVNGQICDISYIFKKFDNYFKNSCEGPKRRNTVQVAQVVE